MFPDTDLDQFVDTLAIRIASFDKSALSETKRFVDMASFLPGYEIAPEWDVCHASLIRPAAQEKIRASGDFINPSTWKSGLVTTSAN